MINPRQPLDQDEESDLPDDLLESIEDTPTEEDDFGDETQYDDEYAVEEGLERTVAWYLENEAWWRALQDRAGVGLRLGTAA